MALCEARGLLREPVLRAISQIQPDAAIELCLAAMQDPSTEVRRVASAGLVRRASAVPAELLGTLAEGLHDPDFIGTRTVEFHVANVIGKLGARNRRDAAAIAARLGLV